MAIIVLPACSSDSSGVSADTSLETLAIKDVRSGPGTFTPGPKGASTPAFVAVVRDAFQAMDREGFQVGQREIPVDDRMAWLVYDPELANRGLSQNWVVSNDGLLPADVGMLQGHLAFLRARSGSAPVIVGFTADGRLVDELTGREMPKAIFTPASASAARIHEGSPGAAAVSLHGSASAELPVVGPVSYRR